MLMFVDTAGIAYANMTDNYKGMSHTLDDKVELYFESATGDDTYDKVILSVKDETQVAAMKGLAGALVGSAAKPFTVIADDVNSVYADPNVIGIDSITLAIKAGTLDVESVTVNDVLTASDSGKVFVFADAAAVLTLPDSGAGDIIGWSAKFVSNFTATGQEVKNADTTNEIMVGALINSDTDDDNSTKAWNAEIADGFSSVEFTGVAEGAIGSFFTLTNIAADRWLVEGIVIQEAGSEASPFAAS